MFVIQIIKRIYGKHVGKDVVSYLHLKKDHNEYSGKEYVGILSSLAKATRFASEEEARAAIPYLQDIYDDILTYEILELETCMT